MVNKAAILKEREKEFELDTSKPFKLNAGSVGVCKFIHSCREQSKARFLANLQQIEFCTLLNV
jgi:aminopeptidase 2